ncbi:MAG: hypothetical protein SPK43_02400 [Candidatus Onthovivens sp.]|nr:hypothetical protein [Candidatus Onthovivens sp.]
MAQKKHNNKPFKRLCLTIILCFGFLILVVLLADSYILISILMIPKTLAYVWTILIEFILIIKKQ